MIHLVVGARGRVTDPKDVLRRVETWARERHVEVLLADARIVFGRDHIESAVLHAERARAQGTMTTRSLSMETLRYLSSRRQVNEALAAAGIRPGTEQVAVVVFGDTIAGDLVEAMGWTADPRVLEEGDKDFALLDLTDTELRTVPRDQRASLALERVALVDVLK